MLLAQTTADTAPVEDHRAEADLMIIGRHVVPTSTVIP